MVKKCLEGTCIKYPIYNSPGETKGLYCKEHKEDYMVDVKHKTCLKDDCNKRPNYNIPGEKNGVYCNKHKEDSMVDVLNKTCLIDTCNKYPVYNLPGETKRLYCKEHKEDNMVDVKNKTCLIGTCTKRPCYNTLGETEGLYCTEHKENGMVDVKNKTCLFDGCTTQPRYNIPGETKGLYCREHKEDGMVNVVNKTCLNYSCHKIPCYNIPGEIKGLYCSEHKEDGMVDIKNKTCLNDGCTTHPSYSKLFKPPVHCAKHKTPLETNKPFPKCESPDCKILPYYTNDDSDYPKRCEDHSLSDDKNIVEKPCTSCNLIELINEDNSLCRNCSDFKEDHVRHAKENEVNLYLNLKGVECESADKIPEYACSRYRPDRVIPHPYFKIILEVDENQHRSYACECEQGRMVQLFQDYGGIPVVFIRYNPDSYKFGGKSIRGSKSRLSKLLELIKGLLNRREPLPYPLSVYYLFYDGYDGVDTLEPISYE